MSLKFEKNPNENSSFAISGRLDSVTAPELEKELSAVINESTSLVIDMKKLENHNYFQPSYQHVRQYKLNVQGRAHIQYVYLLDCLYYLD